MADDGTRLWLTRLAGADSVAAAMVCRANGWLEFRDGDLSNPSSAPTAAAHDG